jgi:hypothetical protein
MNRVILSALGWGIALGCGGWVPTLGAPAPRAAENAKRASVVVVHDAQATALFTPNPERLPPMIERALTNLTGQTSAAAAWLSLVRTQDTLGLKVLSRPGPTSGTRPALVEALVKSLLAAGLPPRQIIVWDRSIADLRQAGFFSLAEHYGVRVAGSAEAGYDENVSYEAPLLGQLAWGDLEFGKGGPGAGRKSHVSKLVASMDKIVTVTPLLNHNLAGVSGALYGLAMGSVDNMVRFEQDGNALAEAVPDILSLEPLYDRLTLHFVDALICQYQGEERQLLHYATALNELWVSRDPVAVDVLAIEELERQRRAAALPSAKPSLRLYQNASLLWLGVSVPRQIDVVRALVR